MPACETRVIRNRNKYIVHLVIVAQSCVRSRAGVTYIESS